MSREHKHGALVTDLGFCLEQLRLPGMPDLAKDLLEDRVAHHEAELGIADLAVANTAEIVPFTPVTGQELVPLAA